MLSVQCNTHTQNNNAPSVKASSDTNKFGKTCIFNTDPVNSFVILSKIFSFFTSSTASDIILKHLSLLRGSGQVTIILLYCLAYLWSPANTVWRKHLHLKDKNKNHYSLYFNQIRWMHSILYLTCKISIVKMFWKLSYLFRIILLSVKLLLSLFHSEILHSCNCMQ